MHTHNHTFQTNLFAQKVWASWCLRAKSRSRTACDVEIIKSLKKWFVKQIGGMVGWQHEGNMDRLGYLQRPHPSTEIILHILHPATSPLQLIHTHPLPSFSPLLVSSPCHHCTACSLAVLPESCGFITSGSSGGLEKASTCSCSNISSGGQRRRGNISSIVTADLHVAASVMSQSCCSEHWLRKVFLVGYSKAWK